MRQKGTLAGHPHVTAPVGTGALATFTMTSKPAHKKLFPFPLNVNLDLHLHSDRTCTQTYTCT